MEEQLKTLRDYQFEIVTDVYFNKTDGKRYAKRNCVFSYLLKKEAIKHFKKTKDNSVKDFIKMFFNLTDELIEDEKKLIKNEGANTIAEKKYTKILTKEVLEKLRDLLDEMPNDEVY